MDFSKLEVRPADSSVPQAFHVDVAGVAGS